MSTMTLDSIRAVAEAKYGSTDIELGDGRVVRLLNPLRLSQEKRAELFAIQEMLSDDADQAPDQEALLADAIRVVADTGGGADLLLSSIGDDLAVLAEVFETYGRSTQVGEASASRD